MAALAFENIPAPSRHQMTRIVVIDEDPAILDYFQEMSRGRFKVHLVSSPSDVESALNEGFGPDLVFLDCHVGEEAGGESVFSVLASIRKSKPLVPVVMLSCSADMEMLIQTVHSGAVDFVLKPFHLDDIERAICKHVPASDCGQESSKVIPLDENTSFVRASKRMFQIESQCRLVAATDIPVLVLGESGTGKEIAAMFMHKMSARRNRNFLKVNCAAMPLDLLESELFGYEQGAFTGAVKSKPGKFELCNGGTIFLDEIGEMPIALQAKLLQVLQDGSFSRLGGRVTIKVDVRVIAATNIDIKAAIAKKSFREDLYYRLNGFTIHVPPLRERREEIPTFARYFLSRNAAKFERESLPISRSLMQALNSYAWPGNLRELENTIKRYLILADEQAIISEIHPEFQSGLLSACEDEPHRTGGLKRVVRGLKGDAESVLITQALEDAKWNRKAAAANLQISYKALLYKIKQYSLSIPERV